MKKYICILAGAALLVACEQKTENVAPAASPSETTETTIVSPSPAAPAETTTTTTTSPVESTPMATMTPAAPETSTTTETTTSYASPTP
jgi:PBP1b-binding outer membrane lipoprotein LpoB